VLLLPREREREVAVCSRCRVRTLQSGWSCDVKWCCVEWRDVHTARQSQVGSATTTMSLLCLFITSGSKFRVFLLHIIQKSAAVFFMRKIAQFYPWSWWGHLTTDPGKMFHVWLCAALTVWALVSLLLALTLAQVRENGPSIAPTTQLRGHTWQGKGKYKRRKKQLCTYASFKNASAN